MAGTIHFLVANTAIMDGMPKMVAVLRLTIPLVFW